MGTQTMLYPLFMRMDLHRVTMDPYIQGEGGPQSWHANRIHYMTGKEWKSQLLCTASALHTPWFLHYTGGR